MTTEYLAGVDQPDDPWVKLWTKVWKEYGGEGKLTNYEIYGMSQAYTFLQALKAAGDDPTRESIVKALEEKGGEFEGPALAPFRYAADSHLGVSGMPAAKLKSEIGRESCRESVCPHV